MALRHILGHFGRGQLTKPHCSWASLLGSLPVPCLSPVTDNCPSLISGRVENGRRFFFFMTKSQPHQCYLVLSVVLIIIILLSPFKKFTSNDDKVTTMSCSQEWSYWPFNRFYSYHFSQVRTNTHVFKHGILRLLSESGQTNRATPILQLNLVILATLREYSGSFLY